MKAGIIFTDTRTIFILTTYNFLACPKLFRKLAEKGITRYVAYEVPIEEVKEKYGKHFKAIMGNLRQPNDLRILDDDGHNVFNNFSINDLREPVL